MYCEGSPVVTDYRIEPLDPNSDFLCSKMVVVASLSRLTGAQQVYFLYQQEISIFTCGPPPADDRGKSVRDH